MAMSPFVVVPPLVMVGVRVLVVSPGRRHPCVRGRAPGEPEDEHHGERDRDHAEHLDARPDVIAASHSPVVIGWAGPGHDPSSR
jgi:hypothetical protein